MRTNTQHLKFCVAFSQSIIFVLVFKLLSKLMLVLELLSNTSASTASYVLAACLTACFDVCVLMFYIHCEQHLVVVEAWALAWVLLQGRVGEGSLAVEPHRGEGRSLEVRAVPGLEQFLLFHT